MTNRETNENDLLYTTDSDINYQENVKLTRILDLHWWSKRWIDEFEKLESGNRMVQGKNYAKKGNVVFIKVQKGYIIAKVKGSKMKPYDVKIEFDKISEKNWVKILDCLSEKTLILAKLLSGEMPLEIDSLFDKLNLSIFPKIHLDVRASCSCADWANPCKHTAAVFYIFTELINSEPLLFFKLKGKTRNEILSVIQTKHSLEVSDKNTQEINVQNPYYEEEYLKRFSKNLPPTPIEIQGIDLKELVQNLYVEAKKAADKILITYEQH